MSSLVHLRVAQRPATVAQGGAHCWYLYATLADGREQRYIMADATRTFRPIVEGGEPLRLRVEPVPTGERAMVMNWYEAERRRAT